jgi:hypothetical protein
MKEMLRNAEQYQSRFPDLTEQEKKDGKQRLEELIETIEKELYPERHKKGGSS